MSRAGPAVIFGRGPGLPRLLEQIELRAGVVAVVFHIHPGGRGELKGRGVRSGLQVALREADVVFIAEKVDDANNLVLLRHILSI